MRVAGGGTRTRYHVALLDPNHLPMSTGSLEASPFGLLDARSNLRLVTDLVHEDDTFCLALSCRPLRDALWARFPQLPRGASGSNHEAGCSCDPRVNVECGTHGMRLRTRHAALATINRLE